MVLTDAQKGTNGNYYTTAPCFHKFEGFDTVRKLICADKTSRKIPIKHQTGDELIVYLGDVNLLEKL